MDWQNITKKPKHDSHVLKFKMQFFPWKLFVFSIFVFFSLGFMVGEIWTLWSCKFLN